MRRAKLQGEKIGLLTILEPAPSKGKLTCWTARCECGNVKAFGTKELFKSKKQKNPKTCGFQCPHFRQRARRERTLHGLSKHPAHAVWNGILQRCLNPNHHAYADYGGRGISVCERWLSFTNFWEDMGSTYERGLDLEREDNNKGYCKSNCVWAPRSKNCRNQRRSLKNRLGLQIDFIEQAAARGIGRATLYYRLQRGLTFEQAIKFPVGSVRNFAKEVRR